MTTPNLVLVVDDDPMIIHLIEKIFQQAGVRIATTPSASGALSLLYENRGDVALMLLDLAMPGVSGYELCRQIRGQPELAELPVVAVTANMTPTTRQQVAEVGINDIIEKPFKPDDLLKVLRRYHVLED